MKSRIAVLLAASFALAAFNGAQAQTKWDMPTPYSDGEFHTRNIKVFVRDQRDLLTVREICAKAFSPAADIAFLNVDLCRADLLVEIEGIVFPGVPG